MLLSRWLIPHVCTLALYTFLQFMVLVAVSTACCVQEVQQLSRHSYVDT